MGLCELLILLSLVEFVLVSKLAGLGGDLDLDSGSPRGRGSCRQRSARWLDILARVSFPALFVLLNILFWNKWGDEDKNSV